MSEKTVESTQADAPAAPKKKKGPGKPSNQMDGTRGFISTQPTSGPDLMSLWDLPPLAYREGRLKVSRRIHPTLEMELLADLVIGEYDLGSLARDFGPGQFFLLLSGDPNRRWGLHNAKVSVSPQYAAAQGYQVYQNQAPSAGLSRISDVNALQATATALATDRPLTVRDLAQLMEMMADKTAEALSRRNPTPQLQGDPMQFFGAVLTMQQSMEDRAFKVAERLLNGRGPAEEPAEPSFAAEMMKLLPVVLNAFKAPPTETRLGTNPEPIYQQAQPPAEPQEPIMAQEPPIQIPLTQEEAGRFNLAVGMLRPWVNQIVTALAQEPDITKVAKDLERFIPPALEQQLSDLNTMIQDRGPAVLAMLSPALANPRGAELVSRIVMIITQE